jgi:hypothetical protein
VEHDDLTAHSRSPLDDAHTSTAPAAPAHGSTLPIVVGIVAVHRVSSTGQSPPLRHGAAGFQAQR